MLKYSFYMVLNYVDVGQLMEVDNTFVFFADKDQLPPGKPPDGSN